jgi:tetratricopeptide (TPR) repeat protein
MVHARFGALALGAIVFYSGCDRQGTIPLRQADAPMAANIKKEAELPKRQPLPSTCVALGNVNASAADDPQCPPLKQQELRETARKAYQQALQLDRNYLPALSALARLYVNLEDYPHAVATYERAIQVHPECAPLYHELGMCYARQKQWASAAPWLRQAVERDSESRQYAHTYGFCLARAGQLDESLAAFARLEGEANAHYNVARMLNHMHDPEQSKQHLLRALELKPDMDHARQLLAQFEAPKAEAGTPTTISNESTDEEQ